MLARRLDQCFHVIQIVLQRLAASRGQAILRPGKASHKILTADNVIGFLQLARVHAQVAICGVEESLEIVEGQSVIGGQSTEDT